MLTLEVKHDRPAVMDLPRLNLGCGRTPKEGWTNMDRVGLKGVDVVHDMLNFPWPFASNTFGTVECSHVLEHIPMEYLDYEGRETDALVAVMNEVYRVMAPGGRFRIEVPAVQGQGAFGDPTHRRFFVERAMWHYSRPPEYVPGTEQFTGRALIQYAQVKKVPWTEFVAMSPDDKAKIQMEAVKWAQTEEGLKRVPPWDWEWDGQDINSKARFDCIKSEYEPEICYLNWILEKPAQE